MDQLAELEQQRAHAFQFGAGQRLQLAERIAIVRCRTNKGLDSLADRPAVIVRQRVHRQCQVVIGRIGITQAANGALQRERLLEGVGTFFNDGYRAKGGV